MVKFRNVRVKMKGGKSRIQRAMVLASGKLRFVKNLGKSRAHKSSRHKTTKKKGGYHMAKHKRHGGGGKSLQRSLEKLVPSLLLAAPVAATWMSNDSGQAKAINTVYVLSGYDMVNHTWNGGRLVATYAPPIAAAAAFKIGHKLVGLLRRV